MHVPGPNGEELAADRRELTVDRDIDGKR